MIAGTLLETFLNGLRAHIKHGEEKNMNIDAKEITVNGVTYVPKADFEARVPAQHLDGLSYLIIRTRSAGVFAGYLLSADPANQMAKLRLARRLWYWEGAATLSQLSIDGVGAPQKCKFPEAVDEVTLFEVIEVLPVTEKARLSIAAVPVWRA